MKSLIIAFIVCLSPALHAQDFRVGATRASMLDTLNNHYGMLASPDRNSDTVFIKGIYLAGHYGTSLITFDPTGHIHDVAWLSDEMIDQHAFDFWSNMISSYMGKPAVTLLDKKKRAYSRVWKEPELTALKAFRDPSGHVTIFRRMFEPSDLEQ